MKTHPTHTVENNRTAAITLPGKFVTYLSGTQTWADSAYGQTLCEGPAPVAAVNKVRTAPERRCGSGYSVTVALTFDQAQYIREYADWCIDCNAGGGDDHAEAAAAAKAIERIDSAVFDGPLDPGSVLGNGVVLLGRHDGRATVCGECGAAWDDTVSTAVTPVPAGRCPFEADHGDLDAECDDEVQAEADAQQDVVPPAGRVERLPHAPAEQADWSVLAARAEVADATVAPRTVVANHEVLGSVTLGALGLDPTGQHREYGVLVEVPTGQPGVRQSRTIGRLTVVEDDGTVEYVGRTSLTPEGWPSVDTDLDLVLADLLRVARGLIVFDEIDPVSHDVAVNVLGATVVERCAECDEVPEAGTACRSFVDDALFCERCWDALTLPAQDDVLFDPADEPDASSLDDDDEYERWAEQQAEANEERLFVEWLTEADDDRAEAARAYARALYEEHLDDLISAAEQRAEYGLWASGC